MDRIMLAHRIIFVTSIYCLLKMAIAGVKKQKIDKYDKILGMFCLLYIVIFIIFRFI